MHTYSRRRCQIVAVLLVLAASSSGAAAEPPTAHLTLDPTRPGATIDRHIFGQFAEHLGNGIYGGVWVGPDSTIPNTRGMRNDVVAALRALQVPVVRWPGGCFADDYHWRKGIGARDKRPTTYNSFWGGVLETNAFGTHEYMDFLDQIGAEAYITGNVGAGTPQEMVEWLEYMTADKPTTLAKERVANGHATPFSVPYFAMGNESNGCGGSMSADYYLDLLKRYTTFAKNYNGEQQSYNPDIFTDRRMRTIAVGSMDEGGVWFEKLMQAWSERAKISAWGFDGISLHYYVSASAATGFDGTQYAQALKDALGLENAIARASAIMDKFDPKREVGLVVDEWGAWYAPTTGTDPSFLIQQNSQRDAILTALSFNIFTRHAERVRMANIAQMVNVLQAMIFTEGAKMVLTPTYHVFRMYKPFQDATILPVSFDAGHYTAGNAALPRLDAIGAKGKDGATHLSLVNLDPNQPLRVDMAINGLKVSSAVGETLSAARFDSVNDFDHPEQVIPRRIKVEVKDGKLWITLPAASVTVVALK